MGSITLPLANVPPQLRSPLHWNLLWALHHDQLRPEPKTFISFRLPCVKTQWGRVTWSMGMKGGLGLLSFKDIAPLAYCPACESSELPSTHMVSPI